MFWQWLLICVGLIAFAIIIGFMTMLMNDGSEESDEEEFFVSLAIIFFGLGICALGHSLTLINFWQNAYLLTGLTVLGYILYVIGGVISCIGAYIGIFIVCPFLGVMISIPFIVVFGLIRIAKDKLFPQKVAEPA